MKTMKSCIKYLFFVIIMTTLNSACNDDLDSTPIISESKKYQLNLTCPKPQFEEGITASRAGVDEWINGDILYFVFKDNEKEINGTAIYSNDFWDIKLETSLTSINGECAIWTTTERCSYNSTTNKLNPGIYIGVYYAKTKWSLSSNGEISIEATLTPTMGRMRFKSAIPQTISLWTSYLQAESLVLNNYFNTGWTGIIELTKLSITCNEEINGEYYSPYIYANGYLYSIKIDDYVYYKQPILISNKKSYTLVCPSESSHDNWDKEKYHSSYLTISGHSFGSTETLRTDFNFSTKTGIIIEGSAKWDSNSLKFSSYLDCDVDGESYNNNLLYRNYGYGVVYSDPKISIIQHFGASQSDSHYFNLTGTDITTQNFSLRISNF